MGFFEYIDIMKQPYDIFCTKCTGTPMHWHYYSEIIYVNSGSIDIICNNRKATLHKGDVCYFYPLQLHSVKAADNEVIHSVVKFNIQTLNIPKAYLQQIYDCFIQRTYEDDFCIIIHNNDNIKKIVQNIISEYDSKKAMYMLAVQSGIQSLLISIARSIDNNKKQIPKHSDQDLSFYHILEYIDAHSSERLEINKLAEMCNMSYSHFAKLFRENYGRSCKQYIEYIRLNKAQDLLLNSDMSIDYIAQETGFYDCSHFIRQYKKWRGITPKRERNK